MALFAKPFNPAQKIIKSIFRGRPNLMADVDVNRQMDIFAYADAQHTRMLGADNSALFIGTAAYNGTGKLSYNVDIATTAVKLGSATFNVVATNFTGEVLGAYKSLVFYLIARSKVVTFAENPTMSGVNATGFAEPLAAADTELWYDEVVVAFPYPDVNQSTIESQVGGSFKLISVLGGIIPVKDGRGTFVPRVATYTSRSVANELKSLLGDKFNGNSLVENLSHFLGLYVSANSALDKIGMTTMYTGPLTGIWDTVSGLGLSGGWLGWAIMDGNNGTQDALGRVFVGRDPADFDFGAIGNLGGQKNVTLSIEQMPNHSHAYTGYSDAPNITGDNDNKQGFVGGETSAVGGGQAHTNLMPFVTMLPVQKIA